MITFHEIKRVIQKMAVLSSHVTQLNQLLPEVVRLSEKIDSLNEDITLERDRMTAKIRSVEVLGEILKTHVYQNQAGAKSELFGEGFATVPENTVEDESSHGGGMVDSDATDDVQNQSSFYPKLDGSSMTL